MNTGLPANPEDRLDAYLDGTLGGDGIREMRARIDADPVLKRQVELQARIDASLRRCCKAPDVEVLLGKAGGTVGAAQPRPGWLRRIGRIAAMVAIGVTAVLAVAWFADPGGRLPGDRTYKLLGLEGSYLKLVGDGFTPDWRCETDEEFATTYAYRLGQPLVLGPLPAGVEALGLSYSPAISYNTISLLARVGGQPVIVYADYARSVEGALPELSAPGIRVFERRMGDIILYEVTPRDTPAILGAMLIPDDAAGGNTR